MIVKRMASLHDYEDHARDTLSRPMFDHIKGFRSDIDPSPIEQEKIQDFAKIKLKLRGMLNLKYFEGIKTTILGQTFNSPICVSQPKLCDVGLVHRVKNLEENQHAIMQVCNDLNQLACVPFNQGYDLKDCKQPILVSITPTKDFDAKNLIKHLPASCLGIVIESGYTPSNLAQIDTYNHFEMPKRLKSTFTTLCSTTEYCFKFIQIKQIKALTKIPVIVKGIMSAENAKLAVVNGADGVWVCPSTFESDPSPISILKHVKAAVPQATVFLQGGIRRGTDVLKAIAYGADAIFLDYETPLWGLHLEGKAGLSKLLDLINEELKLCMVLTHCVNIKQVTERQVIHWVANL